ncbi:DEAD/DEAH box helicase [Cellvibrio sp. pealriver]|uniref:DEAD/DEAH box helicase n=1 Tax=Cellvibrio sp. pealriver TaxID=1622269 RepID=UPI00066FB65B|nr:DEAD/DEAH box helicase [Cellvibrio sp. pealriver]
MTQPVFHDLISDSQLRKAIDVLGYEQPTPVQLKAIPAAVAGENLIVSSKTGSGKTAAFLLPAIQSILAKPPVNRSSTRILILTPTRELARQIVKNAEQLLKFTSLKVGMICGGEELKYQKAMLRKNPEIVVGTPGRLAEHVMHKSTEFSGLEFLVLDEADRMLDMGLSEDVLKITATCRAERQTLLFSATMEQKGLRHLIKQVIQGEAKEIYIDEKPNAIIQQMMLADDYKHKEKLLIALLAKATFEKAIIFTNTKARAAQLDNFLRYNKYKVSCLHGDITQDQRKITLDHFRQGRTQLLVATDVAARGLDIPGVELVVNIDVAHSGDEYLHRIGRTGRADAEGRAVTLVDAKEWNLCKSIERYLNANFETIGMPGLKGKYQGPDKVKASGKAVGSKKKTVKDDKTDAKKPKVKVRERDKKNVGNRRVPTAVKNAQLVDGFAPPKKKISKNLDDAGEE